jgi:hypothetical protein
MHKQKLAVLIAAGVGILGLVLTWFSVDAGFFSYSQNGFSSGWTGWGTLAALGTGAGILFKAEDKNAAIDADTKKIVMGAGAGALLLPIIAIVIVKSNALGGAIDLGIGLFICMIAGAGMLAIPLAMKADGSFEMPTKDSIQADIKGEENSSDASDASGDDATA